MTYPIPTSLNSAIDRMLEIVPGLKTGTDRVSEFGNQKLIGFCKWCIDTFDLKGGPKIVYVQQIVLADMTPDEIVTAYARWKMEE